MSADWRWRGVSKSTIERSPSPFSFMTVLSPSVSRICVMVTRTMRLLQSTVVLPLLPGLQGHCLSVRFDGGFRHTFRIPPWSYFGNGGAFGYFAWFAQFGSARFKMCKPLNKAELVISHTLMSVQQTIHADLCCVGLLTSQIAGAPTLVYVVG